MQNFDLASANHISYLVCLFSSVSILLLLILRIAICHVFTMLLRCLFYLSCNGNNLAPAEPCGAFKSLGVVLSIKHRINSL